MIVVIQSFPCLPEDDPIYGTASTSYKDLADFQLEWTNRRTFLIIVIKV